MAEKSEERRKEEARAENVKKTLENKAFQKVLGTNKGKTNPYEFGQLAQPGIDEAYNDVTTEKDFVDKKKELQEQYNQLGVYGEATTSAVSAQIMRQIEEVKQMAKIGELEKYAKEAGADINFKIPEELKKYTVYDSINKENDLSDEQREDIQKAYSILTQAYDRGATLQNINYFTDLDSAGKELQNKYKKEKSSSK